MCVPILTVIRVEWYREISSSKSLLMKCHLVNFPPKVKKFRLNWSKLISLKGDGFIFTKSVMWENWRLQDVYELELYTSIEKYHCHSSWILVYLWKVHKYISCVKWPYLILTFIWRSKVRHTCKLTHPCSIQTHNNTYSKLRLKSSCQWL